MMNKLMPWRQALLAAPMLLSGCATMTEQNDAYADGWRRGRVVSLVDSHTPIATAYKDCRQAAKHGEQEGRHHVLASYSFGGSPNLRHTMVVPLADGVGVSIGQDIRIDIERCTTARAT